MEVGLGIVTDHTHTDTHTVYKVIVNAVFCEEKKEKFKYMYLLNFAKRNTRKDKQLITYRGWM